LDAASIRKRFFFYLLSFLIVEARFAFPLMGWRGALFLYVIIMDFLTCLLFFRK
jgi:hypothetical protein